MKSQPPSIWLIYCYELMDVSGLFDIWIHIKQLVHMHFYTKMVCSKTVGQLFYGYIYVFMV